MSISKDIWVWVGALVTIGTYSILFKDNPIYRVLESIFVAILAGHAVVVNWFSFQKPTLVGRLAENHEYSVLIPLFLAALMYFRYSKKQAWVARYSMSFVMGIGAAYVLTKNLKPMFLTQAKATMISLWVEGNWQSTLNNLVVVLGVVSVLMYFFFTVKKEGTVKFFGSIGRIYLMIAFGALFGDTVMGRVSVTLTRFQFLLKDWLGVVR